MGEEDSHVNIEEGNIRKGAGKSSAVLAARAYYNMVFSHYDVYDEVSALEMRKVAL